MINKINLKDVKVASYLNLGTFTNEVNKNFETLAAAIESVDAEGIITVPGPAGATGEQGPQGQRGEKGDKGDPGEPGKDGQNGKDGVDGRDGKDGRDGIDGRDGALGVPGAPGAKGDTGSQGIQGLPGKDGVGIKGFASGYVDAGQFVTLDNLKFTVATSGNRGLSCATVSGTATLSIAATWSLTGGTGGNSTTWPGANYTTTPSGSWFGYHFPNAGDGSTYLVNDYTNQRFYRVHLMIGPSYLKNFISIERLA